MRKASALSLLILLLSSPGLAQTTEEDLEKVRGEIADTEARQRAYEKEVQGLGEETKSLRRRLVSITARVLEKEAAVAEAEEQLKDLEEREKLAAVAFEQKSEALVETVAALQILQKNPPPALLVKPDDALDAARSSILLSEIAPALKEQADELAFKLSELRLLRDAVEDQKSALLEADRELDKEREKLQKLLVKREERYKSLSGRATAERARLAVLGERARNLEELLESLKVPPIFPRAKPDVGPKSPPSSTTGDTLASSEGLEIALISRARGHLRPPALGRIVSPFDTSDGTGGKTKGITIATQPNAQVVAPFDGKIAFAGPYWGEGEVLIIEAGEGYHLVLSGMEKVYGVVGQRLLAGEPIGQMGTNVADRAGDTGGPGSASGRRDALKPHLYFEMRKNGKPFDPEPWLAAARKRSTKG